MGCAPTPLAYAVFGTPLRLAKVNEVARRSYNGSVQFLCTFSGTLC